MPILIYLKQGGIIITGGSLRKRFQSGFAMLGQCLYCIGASPLPMLLASTFCSDLNI